MFFIEFFGSLIFLERPPDCLLLISSNIFALSFIFSTTFTCCRFHCTLIQLSIQTFFSKKDTCQLNGKCLVMRTHSSSVYFFFLLFFLVLLAFLSSCSFCFFFNKMNQIITSNTNANKAPITIYTHIGND